MKQVTGMWIGFLVGTGLITIASWIYGRLPENYFAAATFISIFTFIGWLVGKTWDHK